MGAGEIDSLEIQVKATAQKANDSLDALVGKLGELTDSLGKVNGQNLSNLASGVKTLSSSMKNLQGVKKTDFNRLAAGIERIGKLDGVKLTNVGNALKPLADGVSSLSNTNFDNKSLQNLINSITRLSNSNVGNLSNVDFTSIGNSIKSLASSLASTENVQRSTISMTSAVANLAKSAENIPFVLSGLPKLSSTLRDFIKSMSKVDSVVPETISFTQAIASLSNAGEKTATTASHLGVLSKELKKFMETMSNAPVVNRNIIDMTNSLAKLANAGASSGRAANSLAKAFDGFSRSSHTATKKSFSLASAIGKVYATYWMLFRAMGKVRDAIDISSDVTEVQNVVDTTFGNMAYKVDDFAKTAKEKFGMSELSVKTFASQFQAMGTAMGISSKSIGKANEFLNKQTNGYVGLSNSMSDVSINLTKLTGDLASFYNISQEDVAEKLQSIFTGQTRPLRSFGIDLTQATLQEWALKNGIDANVQSMSQAEKTMLRYMYVLQRTGAAHGDFSKTIYTWHNQLVLLKENFKDLGKVVGNTLISALKPLVVALNSVMGNLIAFAETVSNALGKIFGWKFEKGSGGAGTAGLATDMEDAADSAGGLADKTGKAAKNIDKMKAGLRVFDELKTISMPDSSSGSGSGSGGSGGASGGGASGGSGGQWTKQDSIFEDYKSSIDSLKGLGNYIRDALIGEMKSIDWDSIYKKAENFGKGLATFLNGLFESDKNGNTVFGELGTTIAGALSTAVSASLGFTDTFDFEQFGKNLSDGVNNFFKNFDFEGLADAINGWVDGLWATVTGFLDGLSFEDIFNGLKTFLTNLTPESIMTILGFSMAKGGIASKLLTAIMSILGIEGGKDGKKIKINGVGLGIYLANLAFVFSDDGEQTWTKTLLTSLVAAYSAFKLSGGNLFITITGVTIVLGVHIGKWLVENGENIKEKIKELKEKIRQKFSISHKKQGYDGDTTISIPISVGIQTIADNIKNITWSDVLKNCFNRDETKGFFDEMIENFKAVGDSQDIIDAGAHIFEGIMDGFVAAFGFIVEPFSDFFNWVWGGICDAFDMHSPSRKMKPLGKNILLGVIEGWKDKMKSFSFVELGKKLVDKIKKGIQKVKDNVLEFKAKIKNDASEWWKNTKEWWGEKVGDVKEFTTGVKDKASEWWKNTKDYWDKKVGKAKEFTTDVKNSASTWWSNTKSYWSGKVGQVQNFVTDVKNNASTWWSNAKKYWKEKVGDVQSFTTNLKDTSRKWWSDAKRLWNSVKGTLSIGLSLASNALSNIWTSVKNFFSGKSISIGAKATKKADGGVFSNGSWKPIQKYAAGGIPNYGQMFIAREAGPELVGTLGGHTAVMNNDQIVASVSAGVYQAVKSAMGNSKEGNLHITVNLDGKVVYDNVRSRAQDHFNRTGEPAFPI